MQLGIIHVFQLRPSKQAFERVELGIEGIIEKCTGNESAQNANLLTRYRDNGKRDSKLKGQLPRMVSISTLTCHLEKSVLCWPAACSVPR